jgi:hypothetical protein
MILSPADAIHYLGVDAYDVCDTWFAFDFIPGNMVTKMQQG